MGRPGRTPSVVREAFRGPLIAGSDHIPCHRPRKGRKLRRVSDACLPRWLALERNRTPRDHKSLARMGCELLYRASAHTLRWIQTSCKCLQSSARRHCLCSRLPCRLCSALSFLALRWEVSATALFLHGPYICWLCGSCALQRVLEASLALSVRGFCTSCAVASLSLCTVASTTGHGRWRCTGSGCMASRVASFDARRTCDKIGATTYCSRGRGRGAAPCIGA